jgi:hypothetical protein
MREDMFEVIIERPRWGSRMRYPRSRRRVDKIVSRKDPDSLPFRLGHNRDISQHLKYSHKYLSETLNPLRRFLEGQVNRPWNKVFSEICENLKTSSTVQQHVRDHIKDFVATKTVLKDGEVWAVTEGVRWPVAKGVYRFYVDPRTGILRKNKNYYASRREVQDASWSGDRHLHKRLREVAPLVQLHRLDDGAWWEVKLAPIPTERKKVRANRGRDYGYDVRLPYFDVVLIDKLTKFPAATLYQRPDVYAVAKRQLSRQEVIKLGLPR